jgi:hypothetical protein
MKSGSRLKSNWSERRSRWQPDLRVTRVGDNMLTVISTSGRQRRTRGAVRFRSFGWWTLAVLLVTGVLSPRYRGWLAWEGGLSSRAFWKSAAGHAPCLETRHRHDDDCGKRGA